MGTNYYWLRENKEYSRDYISSLVQPKYEMVHIGKSSAGWCFGLHVYPKDNIYSWAQWQKIFKAEGENLILIDEYYQQIDLDYLKTVIEDRSSSKDWKEFEGNLEQFISENNAKIGPRNLLRHKINCLCVGHADGPWDYLDGDFS